MKVSFKYQHKKAQCKACKADIEVGQRAAWYYDHKEGGPYIRNGYHLECWIQKVFQWFDEHPFEHKTRGIRGKRFSPEVARERRNLTERYHRLMRKKRELIEVGDFNNVDVVELKREQVKRGMEELGGVPRSW